MVPPLNVNHQVVIQDKEFIFPGRGIVFGFPWVSPGKKDGAYENKENTYNENT
jgi:hypothetical protein